jgi:crotonobetainyl-CoA:carnitine CoA-transferase CaiB-like acyl-CoA transferase
VGEHTREILGETGLRRRDIEKLAASGVVACYRG